MKEVENSKGIAIMKIQWVSIQLAINAHIIHGPGIAPSVSLCLLLFFGLIISPRLLCRERILPSCSCSWWQNNCEKKEKQKKNLIQ